MPPSSMLFRRCKLIRYWESSPPIYAWIPIATAEPGKVIERDNAKWIVTECDTLVCRFPDHLNHGEAPLG